ncbi:FG-GAP repeat-containing protein [Calothrix parasitica NIES-267]|uniref:FG-GAP repeat-containing protein n=1 Tax=Calothrix parasitica NIES-267 TaxID=1973488 RepID=A0A1Z4LSK4_9CYAN|nr:FG-GAP repeat-containing protein [Calothrix parasitica NIES-267]
MEDNFLEVMELQAEEALEFIQELTEVSIAVDLMSVGEDGGKALKYTFTRTDDDISNALIVNFTVSGEATFDTDYSQEGAEEFNATTGKVTIAEGETTATVTITPIADSEIESDELVKLTVAPGSDYIFDADTSGMAKSAIANDDVKLNVDWAKQFGNNGSGYQYLTLNEEGNTYVTGWFTGQATIGNNTLTPEGNSDTFVAKFDKDGNARWAKNFGGNTSEEIRGIAVDNEGSTYIAGKFRDTAFFGNDSLEGGEFGNTFVAKLDNNGDTLWAKKLDDNNLYQYTAGIDIDNKGNAYITGKFENTKTSGNTTLEGGKDSKGDVFVGKLNNKGDVLWVKDYEYDAVSDITVDAEGNTYIAGRFEDTVIFGNNTLEGGESGDAFVAKFDSNGDVIWAKDFDGDDGYDRASSITLDSEGNIYVAGEFREANESGDIFVAKLNSKGDVLWEEEFETSNNNSIGAEGIAVDDIGNSYVTGYYFGESISVGNFMLYSQNDKSSQGRDSFIAKLDKEGEVKWVQNLGGNNPEDISDIDVNDDKIYITGDFYRAGEVTFGENTFTTQNKYDSFLVKLTETKPEAEKEKPEVILSVNSNSIAENTNNQITYTFTRKGDITEILTVNFTVDGSANFNQDYRLTGAKEFNGSEGKVTFKAGEATANVNLNIIDDTIIEQDETVALSLAMGSNYTVSKTDVAANTITIINDDKEIIVDEKPDIPVDNRDNDNDRNDEKPDTPVDKGNNDEDDKNEDVLNGNDNNDNDDDDDDTEFSLASKGKQTFKFKSKFKNGKSSIKFSFKSKNVEELKEIAVVTVDDDEGTIDGISPDAEGYLEAALNRSKSIFSLLGNIPNGFADIDIEKVLEFSSETSFRFLSVKGGTLQGVKSGKVNKSQVTLSSTDFLQVTESGKNNFDLDFAGVQIKMKFDAEAKKAIGSGLQETMEVIDLREMTTKQTATFTVYREAAFENVIGFYQVTSEDGGIDTDGDGTADIFVGDAGYAQAAVQNRIASIDLKVGNEATNKITGELEAGAIIVPFLMVKGTLEEFDEIFFPYIGANSDGIDHVMMLGDNTFGFEDLPGGGDRDFNDIIAKVEFTNDVIAQVDSNNVST